MGKGFRGAEGETLHESVPFFFRGFDGFMHGALLKYCDD